MSDNPIKEIWHVMCFKAGSWCGCSDFWHPNEAAAVEEELRLRREFADPFWGGQWTVRRFRYVAEGSQ